MVKLPPPVWTAVYLLLAAGVSRLLGAPKLPELHVVALGVALVAIAWIPSLWAFILFRREGTEINPISPTNRKLVARGPYRFTRNPMYLGLAILSAGIAIWVGTWPFFLEHQSPCSRPPIGCTFPSRRPRCVGSSGGVRQLRPQGTALDVSGKSITPGRRSSHANG